MNVQGLRTHHSIVPSISTIAASSFYRHKKLMTQQQQAGAHSHVTPCDRTFWVRQGDILAGAYPGHPDPVKHRKRVEQIAGAGILTWINLTEEDERNNAGEPFARYDRLARDCAVSKKETACLLRFPVPDLGVPSVEQMTSILDAIDLSLTAGRPVYVHCFGGVGRTGTVVCCWLLRHGVVTEEDVFPRLDVL
jgi:hypothetical protein